ncbi:MAG: tyrosine-type recombinase/integrase [Henriciella sp.]
MASDASQSSVLQEWASQLDVLFARCEGAYSNLTLSGYRKDLEIFAGWCAENGEAFLPADPRAIATFFNAQLETCSYATIRRRASAIRFAHVLSDLPSPIRHSEVYLALRRAARTKGRRPKQVLGLTRSLLEKMLAACPDTLAGKRDAALLSVGYDTLCRSSELSWMRVEDVRLGEASIYIPRSKSDPFGDGRFAPLSAPTVELLDSWLRSAAILAGPLFRGLHTGKIGQTHLETSSIRRLMKAAARRANLHNQAELLSGHSMRVGAAQDLLTLGYDTLAIMTAGGWKNVEVVARYVEQSALCVRRRQPLS